MQKLYLNFLNLKNYLPSGKEGFAECFSLTLGKSLKSVKNKTLKENFKSNFEALNEFKSKSV